MNELISIAGQIVSSNVRGQALSTTDLTTQISAVYKQLLNLKGEESGDWKQAIRDDHIVCLFCGAKLRSLGTHLQRQHKMTVREYRRIFNIPNSISLAATDLTRQRSQAARERHQERYLHN